MRHWSFPLADAAPADRRLAEAHSLRPCAVNPYATASSRWVPPPPGPADGSGASWPAPRSGPRGCQAGGAAARLPSTKRLCGACRGLAGGQAASGKSRERWEGRGTQGGAPSSARALAPPLARADQPSQSWRLYTPLCPAPFHPQGPIPLFIHILPFLDPGDFPLLLSLAFFSLLVLLPTPAPLTLTHCGAIFRPLSLPSLTSPILGSFPRQPWPSPTPPGVGGCVCGERVRGAGDTQAGTGPREQGGEPQVGAECLAGSINGAP